MPISDVLADEDYPNLHLLVSIMKEGHLYDPFSRNIDEPASSLVPTFNNLIGRTDFVKILGGMLARLEQAYGHPVDTEFTAHVDEKGAVRINLLQCRPLWLPGTTGRVQIPANIPAGRLLFKSDRFISGGEVGHVRYILYIDPRWYAAIPDADTKKMLGRLVGRINNLPQIEAGKVLMIGPGRWGTSNIDLGINVGYADIDNAAVLVELAREEAGHVPEVSYGTHFFQDLVEQQIIYLPVYPDDEDCAFNDTFFQSSPNCLKELLPDAVKLESVVKVIDVPAAAAGAHARVIADPESRRAACFLE